MATLTKDGSVALKEMKAWVEWCLEIMGREDVKAGDIAKSAEEKCSTWHKAESEVEPVSFSSFFI